MAFQDSGFRVTAVDCSLKMIRYASRRGLCSVVGDGAGKLPFKDDSFDMVAAAFVAHGMKAEMRLRLYEETRRCARKVVLFQDFNRNRHPAIDLIEKFEGSDYFNFIKAVPEEMENSFPRVTVVPVSSFLSWYLCLV